MTKNNKNYTDLLNEIISLWKAGNDEPMDGDEVDRLVEFVRGEINIIEGNV